MSAVALVLTWLLALVSAPASGGDQAVSEPDLFSEDGYRIDRYRRPTPAEPPAGRRIDTPGLAELLRRGEALAIDVQAVTVRPETAEFGLAWLPAEPRWHIPGSVWLPNVGQGRLPPRMQSFLADNLERLTGGDQDRGLVFYCVHDCWMSWNAVKRAAALGYRNLYWYPEGSDGWVAAGLPLVDGHPMPLEPAPPADNLPPMSARHPGPGPQQPSTERDRP